MAEYYPTTKKRRVVKAQGPLSRTDDPSSQYNMSFWVWYNQEAVRYRVDHGDEDALTYYRTGFLPKVRAARANGEIPSLLF